MNSPYWNAPETLEHLYTIGDPNAYYDFHDVILVRDTTDGKLYAAQDSGCSCPSPFESHTFPTDFTEIKSKQEFRDYVSDVAGYTSFYQRDIDAAVELI